MKKRVLWLLLAVLIFVFCACNKTEPETPVANQPEQIIAVFPQGTVVCGVDVSGLTAKEASDSVQERISTYLLTLEFGDHTVQFHSADISLKAGSEDFAVLLEACLKEGGTLITVDNVLDYDLTAVRETLIQMAAEGQPPVSAKLRYDEESAAFILVPEENGTVFDVDLVLRAVENAIVELEETVSLSAEDCFLQPEVKANSETAGQALEQANRILGTSLTYLYAPAGYTIGTETIDSTVILPWLSVGEDGLTLELDPGPITEYVETMYQKYSLSNNTSTFVTHSGREMQIRVPSPGESVDTDALFNDITAAILSGESGERSAPYVPENEEFTADFGGTYVEIDLTSQHLWVYQNGEVVVDTDIVSGCVNTGHYTPGGVYTIKDKERDRYLVGPGYRSWVNFWMPFNGGIGLHDAEGWRWAYGGSHYLYNGSHGCINMTYAAAAKTYEVVSVGTYVILYGGVREVPPLTQSVSGTSSYAVKVGNADFTLDAKPLYEAELKYTSSNPSVVQVSEKGVVTIVGAGTATITVTASEQTGYTAASMTVTITVNTKCSDGDHTWDSGVVTTNPTCNVEGVRAFTCSECKTTKTEAIPMVGHTSDNGVITKAATCGNTGVKTYCCTVCGTELSTEEIPVEGEHIPDSGVVTVEPGCNKDGTKSYACTVCGTILRTESIPATGVHTPDQGTVTKEPTCTDPGEKIYLCTCCGTIISTEAVPPLGHTSDSGTQTKAPTCTENGTMSHICAKCGVVLPDTVIPALGHKYENGVCSGCQQPAPESP